MARVAISSARLKILSGLDLDPRTEPNRTLRLERPCECGCDYRDGNSDLVGYLTGAAGGAGFTLSLYDENEYRILAAVLKRDGVHVRE